MKTKSQTILNFLMAFAVMFTISINANAQLSGLLNKAKKAVKEKVEKSAKEIKNSVINQAESTVNEAVGVEANEESNENSMSSVANENENYNIVEITGGQQSEWNINSPQSELVANVKYYAKRMQDSFSKGYRGLDYEAYNKVRFTNPSVVDVLKTTARSDYDDAVNAPVKMLDEVTLNFLKIATKGLPEYQYGDPDKSKFIEQLNFFINRGNELSGNKEARAFFFDQVWSVLQQRTIGNVHLEGGEAGLSDIENYLQQNVDSQPEEYKWRYPSTLTLAAAKEQYEQPNYRQNRLGLLRAYKQAESEGKFGKMTPSANPSLEKKALGYVRDLKGWWGTPKQAWVGPVTSTKKNIAGVVITKYRSVKVLCEDQGYKVIHNFALYETPADGSVKMTGFGWENGDQEIELVK